jgi:hypothetical protein
MMLMMAQVVDDLEKEKGTKSTWSREGELQAAQESKCNKVGLELHCKKRLAIFPPPAEMSLTKLSLAGKN